VFRLAGKSGAGEQMPGRAAGKKTNAPIIYDDRLVHLPESAHSFSIGNKFNAINGGAG
jgi:hypothetical protein